MNLNTGAPLLVNLTVDGANREPQTISHQPDKTGSKKRYPILNNWEIRGLLAEKEELKTKVSQIKDPRNEIRLLRLQLIEMKSYYQFTKDKLEETKASSDQFQHQLFELTQHMKSIQTSLQKALDFKEQRDADYEKLAMDYLGEKKKSESTAIMQLELIKKISQLETIHKQDQETIMKQNMLIEKQFQSISQIKQVIKKLDNSSFQSM